MRINITFEERDTILAALRNWQLCRSKTKLTVAVAQHLNDIATNGDKHSFVSNSHIDELCERINFGGKS